MRVGVLASGRGTNLQALLDDAARDGCPYQVVVVISDVAEGRALERARQAGVPALFVSPRGRTREDFEAEMVAVLRARRVDLVVLAGYMRLVGEVLLEAYEGAVINIHPSLLPAFPGLEAQRQALEYGVKVSGCTVHFVDRGMDTGPIISQQAVPVREDDSVESLAARILVEEHRLLTRTVRLLATRRVEVRGRRVYIPDPGGSD
ncbi:MAG TPA: phosphoribosylglycinamide formyltransferase [Clostridiales bacterium]|nr:phosphoribosylglycinamide formyltransferase [Clostridiales bacterium]